MPESSGYATSIPEPSLPIQSQAPSSSDIIRQQFYTAQSRFNDNYNAAYSPYSQTGGYQSGPTNIPFSLSGGTFDRYGGNYNPVENGVDNFFVGAKNIGDFWNNLPGNLAYMNTPGTEKEKLKAKEMMTFDSSKLSEDPAGTIGKFVLSLPGMAVGGVPTGIADFGEAVTGKPYHEAEQREDGKWYIPDYQLDASQQAASLGNSVINIGGTFTGGFGRFIGGGGKLISAGLGAAGKAAKAEKLVKGTGKVNKALSGLSEGVVTRAVKSATGKEDLGLVAGLLSDAGNEAIEEGTQGFLDDVRYKQLDAGTPGRMLEGAIWGAAGGGIMGATGRGMSHLSNKIGDKIWQNKADALMDQLGIQNEDTRRAIWATPKAMRSTVGSRMNQVARSAISDVLREGEMRKAGGSGLSMQIGTDGSLLFDNTVIGDEFISQIYLSSDRSAEKVAYTLDTTTDVLDDIFLTDKPVYNGVVYEDQASALNQLMKDNGFVDENGQPTSKRAQVALGRNPDTSYGGFFLDIDHFVHGSGHRVNPLVMAILGSDFDADKSSLYFDPRNEAPGDKSDDEPILNVNGYASSLLVDPETGGSMVDWLYYGISDYTKANENSLREAIQQSLAPFKSDVAINEDLSVSVQDYFADRFTEIMKIEDSGKRNTELSNFFIEFQNKIDDMIDHNEVQDGINAGGLQRGRMTFLHLLDGLLNDPDAFVTSYQTVMEEQFISLIAAADGMSEEAVKNAYYEDWSREGSLGNNTKIFQMTQSLALLNYALGDKGNPIFRQYGQLLYQAKSKPAFNDVIAGMSERIGSETVLDRLIRASFRMVKAGEDPMNSIETIIQKLEFAEVMSKAAVRSQSINSTQKLESLFDIFKEVHNEWVKKYNDWGEVLTGDGWDKSYDSIYKNELLDEHDQNSAAFMRAFRGVFGSVKLSEWIDTSTFPSWAKNFTLDMLIDRIYRENYQTGVRSVLSNLPASMNGIVSWLDSYAKHYTDDLKRIVTMLEQVFEQAGSTVNILERMENNNGAIDPNDVAALLQFFDALHLVVGDRNAIHLRLFATDEFLNSDLGKMLLRADAKGKLQIARCASLRAQFEDVVNDYLEGNEDQKSKAKEILQRMANVSVVHSLICKTVLQGRRDMFEYLTDPTVNLDSIVTQFNSMFNDDYEYSDANLILDSFRTSQNPYDIQSLSKRAKQAQQSVDSFSKIVYDKLIDEYKDFEATIAEATEQDVVDWAIERTTNTLVEIDEELLWFRTYAAITGDIAYAEKARNTNAALLMFLANQYGQNGNLPSHLNLVTAHEHGHITLSDWYSNRYHVTACMMDPTYRQEVWDENQQKVVLMTRDNFWDAIYKKSFEMGVSGLDYKPGQKLNKDMLLRLFQVLPQYCGYFCDAHVGYGIKNGVMSVQGDRKMSVSADFKRWEKDHLSDNYKVERSIKLIQSELMSHSWFNQAIVRALSPSVLSGKISQRQGQRETKELARRIATIVYYNASKVRNGAKPKFHDDTIDMFDRFKDHVTSDIAQQIFDLTQGALERRKDLLLSNSEDVFIKDLIGKLIYADVLQQNGIAPEFNDLGLDIDFTDSFNLTMQAARNLIYTMCNGDEVKYNKLLNETRGQYYYSDGIEEIKRQFSSDTHQVDDNEAAEIYSKSEEQALDKLRANFSSDMILTDSDISSVENIRSRLEELYAGNEEALAKIDGDIDILLDDNGNINPENKQALIDVVNRTTTAYLLKRAARANGIRVNNNALDEFDKFIEGMRGMIESVARDNRDLGVFDIDAPRKIETYANGDEVSGRNPIQIYDLPSMDFLDPVKQSVCARLPLHDAAGGNPALVGINGGMAKKVAALSHEPSEMLPLEDAIGTQMTAREVRKLAEEERVDTEGWRILDVDGETLRRLDSVETMQRYRQAIDNNDDSEFTVFDPNDNPHGLPTANMTFSHNERQFRYHRLGGIIGRIIDHTQEAMVLKAKKKYNSPDRIVVKRNIKNAGEDDLSIDNFVIGDEDARLAIASMFHTFRGNYRKGLREEFEPNGSMEKLGFGDDQARIISQALTPGVKVELLVVNPETGKQEIQYQVIDASCFFGTIEEQQAKFNARMEQILAPDVDGNIPSILSFGVLQVSIEELCYRINRKVNQAYYEKKKYTKEVEEKAYIEAMSDWSDYGVHLNGDVYTALASVTPLGYAKHGQFIMPDSPTRYMGFFTDELGESPSDFSTFDDFHAIDPNGKDAGDHAYMKQLYEERKIPFLCTRSFISKESSKRASYNGILQGLKSVSNLHDKNVYRFGGVGFINDPKQAREAFKWSQGSTSSLYMTEEVYDAWFNTPIYRKATREIGVVEGLGKLYSFDPGRISSKWMSDQLRNPIKASSERRPRGMIRISCVLPSDLIKTGDAEVRILPNSKMMNDVFIDDDNVSFATSSFFKDSNADLAFMNRDKAIEILTKIAIYDKERKVWKADKNSDGWKMFRLNTEHILGNAHVANHDEAIQSMIVRYLADIYEHEDKRPNTNPLPSHPQPNSVVALLSSGGRLTPVISKNLPRNLDYMSINVSPEDGVEMRWHGTTPIAVLKESGATKVPWLGENWKGMASIYFDDLPDNLNLTMGGAIPIDMIGNADTESSRTPEMGDILLARSLYYTMLLPEVNGSFFYKIDIDSNGKLKVEWNDYIKKTWDAKDKESFLSSDPSYILKQLALGKKHVFDPSNKEAAAVFQDIVTNYWGNNYGDPRWLFSSIRCEQVDGDDNPDHIQIAIHPGEDETFSNYEQWELAFENVEGSDMLHLFHQMQHALRQEGISHPICPDGKMDQSGYHYLINANGDFLVNGGDALFQEDSSVVEQYLRERRLEALGEDRLGNENPEMQYLYLPLRFQFAAVLNESTYNTNPSIGSLISRQHQYRRGLDNGYHSSELIDAMSYENFVLSDYQAAQSIMDREFKKKQRREFMHDEDSDAVRDIFQYKIGSVKEVETFKRRRKLLRAFVNRDRELLRENRNGEDVTMSSEEREAALTSKLEEARQKLNMPNLTFKVMDVWIRQLTGTTPPIDGRGTWEIYASSWRELCDEVVENLTSGKKPMPAKLRFEDTSRMNGRYTIPLMTKDYVDITWEVPYVKATYESKEEFIKALQEEQSAAEDLIDKVIPDNAPDIERRKQKIALFDLCAAIHMEWGDESKCRRLFDDTTLGAKREYNNEFAKIMASAEMWTPEEQSIYDACCKLTDEELAYLRKGLESRGYKAFDIGGRVGSSDAIAKTSDAKFLAKILNDAADVSRIMALLNPLITGANLVDRTIHQGTMNLAIHMAHIPIIGKLNPHYSDNWMEQNIVKKSVNDVLAIKLWNSYRLMEFSGTEMAFIVDAMDRGGGVEQLLKWIDDRDAAIKQDKSLHGLVQRGMSAANSMAAGGSWKVKGQMRNFLNEFVVFAEAAGQTFWFKPGDSGKTKTVNGKEVPLSRLEEMLDSPSGFCTFFTTVILSPKDNPSFRVAMQAMNSSKQGDMAQRSALGLVISDICQRMPFANFVITTCLSRFPNYNINKTERVLNYIMPMSSIRYVFTEWLSNTEYGKKLGVQNTQIHAGLKQAILNDIIHLGPINVALIMLALNAVEPPDDEELWGNTEEWTILGIQNDPPWWLEDTLGLALPMACFWRSCDLGKPRLDILMNGIEHACYANPIMRVSDFAHYLTDPFESFNESVKLDQDRFKNAAGGPPDEDEVFNTNALSSGINWLSQFFTPSIIRDIGRNDAMDREKSYKKIKDPDTGEIVYTTYQDAKLRQLTRRNPVLAFLVGSVKGGDWSYFGANMPNTEYYDDYQYDAMQALSVRGIEGPERISKVNQIIATLESTDNMEELAKTGFFLDNETLQAVASQVWDNYHAWDVYYYELQAEGKLNYYAAGGGDYNLGMSIVGEIKKEREMWKQHWYNFYYEKLRSKYISGELTTYTRHNTKYAQDVYGNWYNTGRSSNVLGFNTQYEDTISAVTGKELRDENDNPVRALIPQKTELRDLGKLEDWSARKDGNTYSAQYQSIYGDSGNTSGKDNDNNNKTSYPRGGYGGGGYRKHGGGGGGGRRGGGTPTKSGTPGISTPIIQSSNPSRIMNTDRIQKQENVAYLRPDFETKGSREAYKRSDI